jgi:hypothetical protein
MLFPNALKLFCANCGGINEENRININNRVIWGSFYHLLNYEFTCFRCGTLNQAEIQSERYQKKMEARR